MISVSNLQYLIVNLRGPIETLNNRVPGKQKHPFWAQKLIKLNVPVEDIERSLPPWLQAKFAPECAWDQGTRARRLGLRPKNWLPAGQTT